MADPYLESMERALLDGARDLHQAAEKMGVSFETACNTFNNGLLKGYWKVVLADQAAAIAR
jgi:hypothetical protein